MFWYLAPRYYTDGGDDPSAAVERPGHLVKKAVEPWPGGVAFRVPAYDRTEGTCLVGLAKAASPSGWVALNLDEAKAAFLRIKGREPTKLEVF